MEKTIYNQLQLRELFHIEFLRWFVRKVKPELYALKGGSNLRFFYNSFRYSEDMDIDVKGIEVEVLKDIVMKILSNVSFHEIFKTFGVAKVVVPDMIKAKQTQTTQRFKVHLVTFAGEDLFTKIEFSRRGFKGTAVVEPLLNSVLRPYKIAPLLVSHYDIESAIMQKIGALLGRSTTQARDIFDLYVLSSQCHCEGAQRPKQSQKAQENVFSVGFEQFRDTVLSYLAPEDQAVYDSSSSWDEIKLKVSSFIVGQV
ncbi:MAG: nucleotidyl transferase AbiEii/AbiGii toxin family protein [Candidatus Gorgyraea atricola]|nr:nucleotidyl transferase AbiEii/AbiGii toxin family protein [Candidatus Gorgyraea atricola]